MNINHKNLSNLAPKIHEGVVLRALVSLYKGSASNLADDINIKLNRLNYLYKMDVLPTEEMNKILKQMNNGATDKWHKPEIEALDFHHVFQHHLQQYHGKKNSENIISGDGNNVGVENSSISQNVTNDDSREEIKNLVSQLKSQQIVINELKEEKKDLLKISKKLTALQEKLQNQLFSLMNKK